MEFKPTGTMRRTACCRIIAYEPDMPSDLAIGPLSGLLYQPSTIHP